MMLAGYNIGPKIMRLMKYVLPKQSWISLTPEYLLKSYMSQERECLFNDSEGTKYVDNILNGMLSFNLNQPYWVESDVW